MTNPTPVIQGKPDWLPQLASSNISIIRVSESIAALKQYGPVYAGNTPYLYVDLSAIVGAELGVAWFADQAGTQSLFGDVITTDANALDAIVPVPARGPYVKFTAERAAYPGTITFDAFAVPSRFNVYPGTDGENALISSYNFAVGAGAALTLFATTVRQGRAHWMVDGPAAVSFEAQLRSVNFSGVTTLIDWIGVPERGSIRPVFIPSQPMRITIINNDAVARNFNATLIIHNYDY